MKVVIISDVHNNTTNLKKVLDFCAKNKIGKIICCGDLSSNETLDFLNDHFSVVSEGSTFGAPKVEPTTPSENGLNGTLGGSSGGIELPPEQVAGMRVKIRKTKKKSYRIGKHDDVVGVLLKNKQTQRHIQTQHLALKQKTIGEIRKYLYEHHLLKVGSNAPPDVLRRMYEDSILTGDVKNTNNEVLLHNFMSGGGGGE